jgi:hypothetical protein
MKSIKFFLLLVACVVFTYSSYAQAERTPKTPDERATALTEWMKTNLQLTAEQVGPVTDLNLKYANLNEKLRNSTSTRMQKAKTLKANEQDRDSELKAVLSAEQFKLYESKKKEMKEKFNEEAQSRRTH